MRNRYFGVARRTSAIMLVTWFAAWLVWPAAALSQQQLPSVPAGDRSPKKPSFDVLDALGQITPREPKKPFGIDKQKVPGVSGWGVAAPASQPVDCSAFKGSAADMSALRATARETAARRAIAAGAFDPLIPKNCAGQEWAFYLRFLASVGEGKL